MLDEAGVGKKVIAVADWFPNTPGAASEAFYKSFRQRFPKPQDDYVHMQMQLLVESLAQSMEAVGATDSIAVAAQLERASVPFS